MGTCVYFKLDYCLYVYNDVFRNLLHVEFLFDQLSKQYRANILKYLWICPLIPKLTDATKEPNFVFVFLAFPTEQKVLDSFCLVIQVLALTFLACWLVSHR